MIRVLILVVSVLILASAVWVIGPSITLSIQDGLIQKLEACQPISDAGSSQQAPLLVVDDEACDRAFARLGQTGDLFGSMASVFSGLALIAVAFTVWLDASNRRTSRKPVVISLVNEESVVFDEPNGTKPRAIRASINLDVTAINDVALNVAVRTYLVADKSQISMGLYEIPTPVQISGVPVVIDPTHRLSEDEIDTLISALKKNENSVSLLVKTSCNSLEGQAWSTEVRHNLKFRAPDIAKIYSLDGNDQENFAKLWADQATVLVDHAVAPNSWRHKKM